MPTHAALLLRYYRKESNMNFLFCQENFYHKFGFRVFFVVLPKELGDFLITLSPNRPAFKQQAEGFLKSEWEKAPAIV